MKVAFAKASPNNESKPRPEDLKLGTGASIVFGLQHILTMYAGLIAVPLIIAQAVGLSAADTAFMVSATFFMGGVITLVQTIGIPFFGAQLPLVQGVSFDAVATMLAIIAAAATSMGGLQMVFGATIVASVICVLIAPVFSRFIHFFPPVVTGSLITVIGLSLVPVALSWSMGASPAAADYGSLGNIGLAAATLVIGLLLSKTGQGLLSRLSILLAIVAGTIIAILMGKADVSSIFASTSSFFAIPSPLHFGWPKFDLAASISMTIAMLVIMTETTADLLAIGEVVGTKVDSKRFTAGLRADMASGLIAPFFGSFPQSAFAQNIGLVAVTGVKSRYVVAMGGVLLILMGVFPFMGAIVTLIPAPVLGGAGVLLFGSVAASGVRMLGPVNYEGNMNLVIVAVTLSVGILPTAEPHFYDQFPVWFQTIAQSGISSAAIVAVLLNLLFNHISFGKTQAPSVINEGLDHVTAMQDSVPARDMADG